MFGSRCGLGIFALVWLAFSVRAAEREFVIAREGRPMVTIVTAQDIEQPFDEGIKNPAVRDLVRIVARMSESANRPGAALPVVEDSVSFADGPQIHLGLTRFVRSAGFVPDTLAANGYRILTTEENGQPRLVIAGTTKLATANGVYDLLARDLGVVWGMAGDLFEEIPLRATISVRAIDRTTVPAFASVRLRTDEHDWARRNRVEDGWRNLPYTIAGHNIISLFPVSQYRDHPEYYAFHDGKRQIPTSEPHARTMICPSHPDVVRITIEKVRAYFDAHADVPGFSLCGSDDDAWCECERCAALDTLSRTYGNDRQYSESYFTLIDTVARALMHSHPDRYITAYAYWTTFVPPKSVAHLPPNVAIHLTQDASQHFDSRVAEEDYRLLREWRARADHICMYEYGNLGWVMPRNFASLAAKRIKTLADMGIDTYYSEELPHWPLMAPKVWLTARLLWEPELDPNATLDVWYAALFRSSAHNMKQFYETLDRSWNETERRGGWMAGRAKIWEQLAAIYPATREQAWREISAAYDGTRDEIVRRRIDYIRRGYRFALLLGRAFDAAHGLSAQTTEAEIRSAIASFDDAMASYHADIESDPSYGDVYYNGRRFHELVKWSKWDLLACVDSSLVARPELRGRLIAEDPTLADAYNTVQNLRMAGYLKWARKEIKERHIWPSWIEEREK
jgi:hypothetical protein